MIKYLKVIKSVKNKPLELSGIFSRTPIKDNNIIKIYNNFGDKIIFEDHKRLIVNIKNLKHKFIINETKLQAKEIRNKKIYYLIS